MRGLITMALVFSPLSMAMAQDASMPRFDVENHCQQVAEMSGGSHMIYNGCMDMEQSAYDGLKGRWGGLPDRVRSHCRQVAEVGGGGSYSTLQGCVQMEMEAADNPKSFQY